MSTRGLVSIKSSNKIKSLYSHSSSSPESLGSTIIYNLTIDLDTLKNDLVVAKNNFEKFQWVDDSRPNNRDPEYQDFDACLASALLLGESLGLTDQHEEIRSLYSNKKPLWDSADFMKNLLFCEWVYLVDLDEGLFKVRTNNQEWLTFSLFNLPDPKQFIKLTRAS